MFTLKLYTHGFPCVDHELIVSYISSIISIINQRMRYRIGVDFANHFKFRASSS